MLSESLQHLRENGHGIWQLPGWFTTQGSGSRGSQKAAGSQNRSRVFCLLPSGTLGTGETLDRQGMDEAGSSVLQMDAARVNAVMSERRRRVTLSALHLQPLLFWGAAPSQRVRGVCFQSQGNQRIAVNQRQNAEVKNKANALPSSTGTEIRLK